MMKQSYAKSLLAIVLLMGFAGVGQWSSLAYAEVTVKTTTEAAAETETDQAEKDAEGTEAAADGDTNAEVKVASEEKIAEASTESASGETAATKEAPAEEEDEEPDCE